MEWIDYCIRLGGCLWEQIRFIILLEKDVEVVGPDDVVEELMMRRLHMMRQSFRNMKSGKHSLLSHPPICARLSVSQIRENNVNEAINKVK